MPEVRDLPSSSRALVALRAPRAGDRPHTAAPAAPAAFLAHLIAASARVPQLRDRRRVEPAEAAAAYRSTVATLRRMQAQ